MKTVDLAVDLVLTGVVVFLIGIPAYYYGDLPDEIPIHFNAKGHPDNYGDKSVLWILSVVGVILIIGLRLVRDQKESFNYPVKITDQNREGQYILARGLLQFIAVLSGAMFCFIVHYIILISMHGLERAPGWIIPLFVLLFFGGLIVYMLMVYRVNRRSYL